MNLFLSILLPFFKFPVRNKQPVGLLLSLVKDSLLPGETYLFDLNMFLQAF